MHILYACIWKCQSLANDVCKEQMPHCKFQSEMSEAVKVAKLFCNKLVFRVFHRTDALCRWSFFANGRLERRSEYDSHPSLNVTAHRPLCFSFQALNFVCIFHGTIVLDIFFDLSKHKAVVPHFFPFHMVLPSGSRPGAPHHQCHPEKRQAEALHRRALAGREAHLGANHRDAQLDAQPRAAPGAAGEAG